MNPPETRPHPSDVGQLLAYANLVHIVEGHFEMLEAIVGRLVGGDCSSFGYMVGVRDDDGITHDRLTDMGLRAAQHAHELAVDADRHLWAVEGELIRDPKWQVLTSLLYDASRLLTVVSAALGGFTTHPDPPHVAWGAHELLKGMLERVRSDDVQAAAKEANDAYCGAGMKSAKEAAHV